MEDTEERLALLSEWNSAPAWDASQLEARKSVLILARQLISVWGTGEGPDIDPTATKDSDYVRGWIDGITHAKMQINYIESLEEQNGTKTRISEHWSEQLPGVNRKYD